MSAGGTGSGTIGDLRGMLSAMRVPRAFRSCYNCKNRYGCGVIGAPPVPLMMDEGRQCGFWRPQDRMFVPTETELAGMKIQRETKRGETKVKNGYCERPEWYDEEGCPMDNPNEEIEDCGECCWFRETEEQE